MYHKDVILRIYCEKEACITKVQGVDLDIQISSAGFGVDLRGLNSLVRNVQLHNECSSFHIMVKK